MNTVNLEQASRLRKEASALCARLYDATYKTHNTNEYAKKAQRILRKAHCRYDRRVELQADIKYPQRKARRYA